MKNICDLASEIFNMPIKIGIPDSINGKIDIINNPRFSTAIGIVQYVINNSNRLYEKINFNKEDTIYSLFKEKIKGIIKNFN